MYEAFFHLTGTPFTRGLPTDQLLTTTAMAEVGARLDYVARERCFAVLTGNVGAGKSTAIRAFIARLPSTCYTPLYVTDSQLTPRNFYHETLWQLGIMPRFYRGDARRQLHRALQERDDAGQQPVIVIDEAHLLGREMLEEVRFLLNFDIDSRAPLALILAGQPELRTTLKLETVAAIAQRVNLRAHLPRSPQKKAPNISSTTWRKPVPPGRSSPNQRYAFYTSKTGGLPRLINSVASACMLYAYTHQRQLIDDALVKEVIDTEFD